MTRDGACATTAAAAIGAAISGGSVVLEAVRDAIGLALALRRAPCPGWAFAAIAAASVGTADLAVALRFADEGTLEVHACFPGKAGPTNVVAIVGTTLFSGTIGNTQLLAFAAHALLHERACAAEAAASVGSTLLPVTLRKANRALPRSVARLVGWTCAAKISATIRATDPPLTVRLTWWSALVVGIALEPLRAGTTTSTTTIVSAALAGAGGLAACSGVLEADLGHGTFTTTPTAAVVTANPVDTARYTGIWGHLFMSDVGFDGVMIGGVQVLRADLWIVQVTLISYVGCARCALSLLASKVAYLCGTPLQGAFLVERTDHHDRAVVAVDAAIDGTQLTTWLPDFWILANILASRRGTAKGEEKTQENRRKRSSLHC